MSLFRIKYEWTEWKIKKNCTKPKAGMYAIATSFQIHRNQTHIQKPQNPLQSVLVTANVCLQSNARNNNNEPNNNNSVNKKSSLTHNFRGDWHDLTIYCAMPTCSGRHAVIFYISFFLFINVFIRAFWFASFFFCSFWFVAGDFFGVLLLFIHLFRILASFSCAYTHNKLKYTRGRYKRINRLLVRPVTIVFYSTHCIHLCVSGYWCVYARRRA